MQSITGLDIVMVLLIVGGSLNGLRIGAVRQLAALAVFYLSVILTTRFYRLLLPSARNLLVGAPTAVLEAVIFALILLVVYAVLSVLIINMTTMRHADRGSKKTAWRNSMQANPGESAAGTLNHLAGIPLGFFTAALWIGVGLLVYRFMISSSWLDWEDYRQKLAAGYQGSMLVPIFRSFLPYALKALEPWFPSGLPSIFLIN